MGEQLSPLRTARSPGQIQHLLRVIHQPDWRLQLDDGQDDHLHHLSEVQCVTDLISTRNCDPISLFGYFLPKPPHFFQWTI